MSYPTTMTVRPAVGLNIRDPETGNYLPESGQIVPRSSFWLRRLKDGDVVECQLGIGTAPAEQEA